jgi:carboxymethylenebutenolidase
MEPKELERLWSEHLDGEFGTKDVDATVATMVDDAYINHMPVILDACSGLALT